MLKVSRDAESFPSTLASVKASRAREDVETVLRMDARARSQRRMPFDSRIYAAPDVRASLERLFEGRCAYCETRLFEQHLSVDHFRPARVASRISEDASDGHYGWLVYEWRNLYPACRSCNTAKGASFPVRGARAPVFSTLDEARALETALLVDPGYDEPSAHLTFRWNGVCESLSERGTATISVLRLNRPGLLDERRRLAAELIELLDAATSQSPPVALRRIEEFVSQRPGGCGSLLRRFMTDLSQITIRRGSIKKTLSALLAQLKDLEPGVYHSCLEDARAQMRVDPSLPDDTNSTEFAPVSAERIAPRQVRPRANEAQMRSIRIEGFKALGSIGLSLLEGRPSTDGAPCVVLLGENATGKSSILEAVALALVGTEAASKVANSPSDYLRRKDPKRWALVEPERTHVVVDFFGTGVEAELTIDPARQVFEGTPTPTALVLAYGPRRFFSRKRTVRRGGPERRIRTLFDPEAVIPHPAPWLNGLADRDFDAVARALREVLALHVTDEFVRDRSLGFSVRVNGLLVPLDRMSEGYKSLLALTVDIIRELMDFWSNLEDARAVVLIDEVETHLHPRWKMRVMAALRRALPNVTFIVTTHDPLCLRGLDDGEVSVLVRDENQVVEFMRDLPSIKGLRAEQLLTSDYFGLSSTADPEAEATLVRYAGMLTVPEQRRSEEQQAELSEMEARLSRTLVIGDTATEQVVAEAMREFLDARRGAPVVERTAARRRAVSAVLDAFSKPPRA